GIVARLGVGSDVDALLATSTDAVLDALPAFREDGAAALPFEPVVDGTVLSERPLAAIAGGNAAGVRVLTGTNADEMTLFTVADPAVASLDDAGVRTRMHNAFGDAGVKVFDSYRALRPDMTSPELWVQLATDGVFRLPAIRLLEAQLAHGPVWSYFFTF